MGVITKPAEFPVETGAYVKTLQAAGSTTIESQFRCISVICKGTSGTYDVTIEGMATQTLSFDTVFNLPYVGKNYLQSVVVHGTDVLEIAVIY